MFKTLPAPPGCVGAGVAGFPHSRPVVPDTLPAPPQCRRSARRKTQLFKTLPAPPGCVGVLRGTWEGAGRRREAPGGATVAGMMRCVALGWCRGSSWPCATVMAWLRVGLPEGFRIRGWRARHVSCKTLPAPRRATRPTQRHLAYPAPPGAGPLWRLDAHGGATPRKNRLTPAPPLA